MLKEKKKRRIPPSYEVQRGRRVPAVPSVPVTRVVRGIGEWLEEARRYHASKVKFQGGDGGGGRRRRHGECLRASARAERFARHNIEAGTGVRSDLRED